MTREELLERVFSRKYEELKGKDLRLVRVKVIGREISLAQLIGEDHTGESIGLLHITPWEATVAAADIAMKSGDVELGFLDRFSGAVILLGSRAEVRSAMEHVLAFFRHELHFTVCEITES